MDENIKNKPVLKVKGLKKYFPAKKNFFGKPKSFIKAVDGVNLLLLEKQTLGIVGESGCGKTTLARSVLRLTEPDQGQVFFQTKEITGLCPKELSCLRDNMQIIFQDPFNSLDPRFSVYEIIKEGIANFSRQKSKKEIDFEIRDIVRLVGLPQDCLDRFPHEFSGGQRQRISIARSLILKPDLLVLDEPVSSLDVSIQAQIINLLLDLQDKFSLSYMFIGHDLDVVRVLSDRICVMYKGKIIEEAACKEFFANPRHPYTRMLISSSQGKGQDLKSEGLQEQGCIFSSKCSFRQEVCCQQPPLIEVAPGHKAACWLV
jgi:oligopeptide/dipeptide ABC transporter ATP-binding protein